MNTFFNVRVIVATAMFAAISALLMYLEFPLPFMPPFLKLDFSDIPALIASFALGPISGVTVVLLKNFVHLLSTQTAGVGELANFLVGAALVLPAGLVYSFKRTFKGALVGMALSTISICLVGMLVNYFILIPFYVMAYFKGSMSAVIDVAASVNPSISDLGTLIVFAIAPFNLIKGIIVSLVTLPLYKRLAGLIGKFNKKDSQGLNVSSK